MHRFQNCIILLTVLFSALTFISCDDTGDRTLAAKYNQAAHDARATSDGGCIVVGETVTAGGSMPDFYVVKLDSTGRVQWSKTEGGSRLDSACSVRVTGDGGYIVAGVTESSGPGDPNNYGSYGNMMVVKYGPTGTKQWLNVYGNELYEGCAEVVQTSDGGYALGGYTHSFGNGQFYLVKLNSAGAMEWDEVYGGEETTEVAYSLKETRDGGFILAGSTIVNGRALAMTVKTNSLGVEQWTRTYGDSSVFNWIRSIVETADGSFVTAGYKGTDIMPNNDCNAWVMKLDASGALTWEQTIGGSRLDIASSIQADGTGYVFAGETRSFGSGNEYESDIWAVKLDAAGAQVWSRTYGGADNDTGAAIDLLSGGGYVLAGDTMTGLANGYDIYVARLDSSGNN